MVARLPEWTRVLLRWLRRVVAWTAAAYVPALLVAILLLRFVGEDHWAVGVVLYLPRWGFGLPALVLVPALLLFKLYRLLWTQLVASILVVTVLMGAVVSVGGSSGRPSMRLLSMNADRNYYGDEVIVAKVLAEHADVVVLQELDDKTRVPELLRKHYPVVLESTEFLLASRFPATMLPLPPKVPWYGVLRSPRFVSYRIESPLGPVTLFSVHPISPRRALSIFRGHGARHEIISGRAFSNEEGKEEMAENTALRKLQVAAFAAQADHTAGSVLIAGDTNLPVLSPLFERRLGHYRDGFEEAGVGFGYTFPSKLLWMRIDRILSTPDIRFSGFHVGCVGASDHRCVVAGLESEPH